MIVRLDIQSANVLRRTATYCGVPILDCEGEILGTLCHFDDEPRDPDQIDLPLMLSVASALSRKREMRTHLQSIAV